MITNDVVYTPATKIEQATVSDKNQHAGQSPFAEAASQISQTVLTPASQTGRDTPPEKEEKTDRDKAVSWYKDNKDQKNFLDEFIEKKYIKKERINYKEVCKTLGTLLYPQPEVSKLIAAEILKEIFMDTGVCHLTGDVTAILEGIIKKEHEEASLFAALKEHPHFKNFPKENLWRLVVDFYRQEALGQYGFEDEPGYTAAMFKALGQVITHTDEKITAKYLCDLHGLAVGDVLDTPDARENPAHLMDGNNLIYMRRGYRETQYCAPPFYLILPHRLATPGYANATNEGIHELWSLQKESEKDASKKPAFKLCLIRGADVDADGNLVPFLKNDAPGDAGVAIKLFGFSGTAQECEALAQEMIDVYHEELARAHTDDDKLMAIARLSRSLEAAHLFHDGNARLIGIILLNQLLLQNGFSPAILLNPNMIDGLSLEQLVAAIKQGQRNFNTFLRADEVAAFG